MSFSLRQFVFISLLCAFVLHAESRFVRRQQQETGRFTEQEQQAQYQQGDSQQQQQFGDEDEDGLIQQAVEQAESNPQIVTQGLNDQELAQFGQDVEKYEQEVTKETEIAGHKGQITKDDVKHVEEKNESKPWYLRLRNWAGRKLNQITDKITKL